MKRLFLAIIIAMASIACGGRSTESSYFVTPEGDSISTDYLIGERRVGDIERGATVKRLNKLYGENYVKQLKDPSQEFKTDSNTVATYYVYNEENHLLMIARTEESIGDAEVKSLVLKDKRFITAKGITRNSTVDEVRQAYPDAMVIQYENRFFVYVASLDLYFRIDESNIRGVDSEFIIDIPIDSLRGSAHFENMSVSWNSNNTNILTSQFWSDMITRIIKWTIYELPSILFIIIIFALAKRLLNFVFKKIKLVARNRLEDDNTIDSDEALKRIDTITGILLGVLNILIWSIFTLILLSKFNINIAPILASAGILGLAVGFGAQELVRDFICGFFILLEDQLRTGDMAIINGTTGVVEKIELRTVTLRDPSGVVHIFQNGKIDTLSNMTKEWSAIILEIGVAYKENVDHVIAIMKEVGAELRASKFGEMMLNDVEIWGLDSFGDSAVVIKMVIKTRPMKQWRVKREYQRLLKIRFDAEGIEIPFPHVTLYTGEQTKPMPIDIKK
ncbi:MAG: mechanosensitive ion channel family protein [Rikenellaceae bacterium]